MKSAAEKMKEKINTINFKNPKSYRLSANVTAQLKLKLIPINKKIIV